MARRLDSGKERHWLQVIRSWQRSQRSVRDFCGRRGLSEPSFYAWRRVLRERGLVGDNAAEAAAAVPTFVSVAVDGIAELGDAEGSAIDVIVAQGRALRVRAGFDAELLRQLLRVLEEPSC